MCNNPYNAVNKCEVFLNISLKLVKRNDKVWNDLLERENYLSRAFYRCSCTSRGTYNSIKTDTFS